MKRLYCWATKNRFGMIWCWLSEDKPDNLDEGVNEPRLFSCFSTQAIKSVYGFIPEPGVLYTVTVNYKKETGN